MRHIKTTIGLALITSIGLGYPSPAKTPINSCRPIGRVLKSELATEQGKQICEGVGLSFPQSKGMAEEFLCYLNHQVLRHVPLAQVFEICKGEPTARWKTCRTSQDGLCLRVKTAEHIHLLTPYSNLILGTRPLLTWTASPTANHYRISLQSLTQSKVAWIRDTQSPTLNYPPEQQPLQLGETYRLEIAAFADETPVAQLTAQLTLPTFQEQQTIQTELQSLKSLNLAKAEQYLDVDAIFMGHGLLTESLGALTEIRNSNANNPDLWRLLGDRYLDAGQYALAMDCYHHAYTLAQAQVDTVVLKLLQERYSQLGFLEPTANE